MHKYIQYNYDHIFFVVFFVISAELNTTLFFKPHPQNNYTSQLNYLQLYLSNYLEELIIHKYLFLLLIKKKQKGNLLKKKIFIKLFPQQFTITTTPPPHLPF